MANFNKEMADLADQAAEVIKNMSLKPAKFLRHALWTLTYAPKLALSKMGLKDPVYLENNIYIRDVIIDMYNLNNDNKDLLFCGSEAEQLGVDPVLYYILKEKIDDFFKREDLATINTIKNSINEDDLNRLRLALVRLGFNNMERKFISKNYSKEASKVYNFLYDQNKFNENNENSEENIVESSLSGDRTQLCYKLIKLTDNVSSNLGGVSPQIVISCILSVKDQIDEISFLCKELKDKDISPLEIIGNEEKLKESLIILGYEF